MLEQIIIAMAVLLTLFYAQLTESSSSCNPREVEIKRVDVNAPAFVPCPVLPEYDKLLISLYKRDTILHSTNLSDLDSKHSRFEVSAQNSSVSYKILRTEANDTGLYFCKMDTQIRTPKTILLIKDRLQPTESPVTCETDNMALAIGCGLIFTYDLLITIGVCYLTYKLSKTELPENPYINTRPIGFQRRR